MMQWHRIATLSALTLLLAGCWNGQPEQAQGWTPPDRAEIAEQQNPTPKAQSLGLCGEAIDPALGLKLSIARQQQREGRLYAALAGLNSLKTQIPTYQLVRANLLRKLGQFDEAGTLYEGLASTCLKGQALYGMGLVDAWKGQVSQALSQMNQAIGLLPTDADLRNDYGFLLLMTGQDAAARGQLMTALELDNNHREAARNLWFLLLKQQDDAGARALAQRFDYNAEDRSAMLQAIHRFRPLRVSMNTQGG
ncbi:tetratricopeptide repeat protein [Pokkaliibacter sp. CJK22405]|uniref:tetratricopeptide repeat protein n=1 Tax=Pokkaliibacter sp. CJK22405 TaxID=3384615 RepID=UPI0039849D14